MSDIEYILTVALVMAVATFSTRIFPFIFFQHHKEHPMMHYVAKYTPPMIMTILVAYVLKDTNWTTDNGFYTIAAASLTVAIHLWKANPLFSIFAGTFFYMFLLQM